MKENLKIVGNRRKIMTTSPNYKERLRREFGIRFAVRQTGEKDTAIVHASPDDIFDFFWSHFDTLIAEEREELKAIQTELHNGRTENAYKMINALLHEGEEDNSPSNTN